MSKEAIEISFPPRACNRWCANCMNEKCVTECSLLRDCSSFEPIRGLNLTNMGEYTTEGLTEVGKGVIRDFAIKKTFDHFQGKEDEPRIKRNYDRPRSFKVFEAEPCEVILPLSKKTDTPSETG